MQIVGLITYIFIKRFLNKLINTKFDGNPSSGMAAHTRGQTDGHDGSKRRFRYSVNEPKTAHKWRCAAKKYISFRHWNIGAAVRVQYSRPQLCGSYRWSPINVLKLSAIYPWMNATKMVGALKGRTVDKFLKGRCLASAVRWQNNVSLRLEHAADGACREKITFGMTYDVLRSWLGLLRPATWHRAFW